MPPPEGRAGNVCVYVVSCLFLVVVIAGGSFLVLYIALPESEDTVWFLIAGMALVGIPWLFWILTCLYRTISWRKPGGGGGGGGGGGVDRPHGRAAAVAPVTGGGGLTATNVNDDSMVDSPGGARRVRFGAATVMGGGGVQESSGGSGSDSTDGRTEDEADGDSRATAASSVVSNEDRSSSLTSHESEVPLFPTS